MMKLLSLVLLASLGCSALKKDETTVATTIDTCAKQDLGTQVSVGGEIESIGLAVLGIIFEGGMNWQADLAALSTMYGPELVTCAEQVAEAVFRTAPASAGSGSALATATEQTQTPHDRAVLALSK